eukprot:TRINITY_DN3531_c0_g1_i5.p2 TRINITY_DN3531_c0_g1~~TRINITY_DN3531_c0_g1_i5.p2  ORF type:complete len:100 (+),score=25.89 TRINITY_DN3531_c0_g1_i5:101-400(+)
MCIRDRFYMSDKDKPSENPDWANKDKELKNEGYNDFNSVPRPYDKEESCKKHEKSETNNQWCSTSKQSIFIIFYVERACLLYTSPSPRDRQKSRMPSSA